MVTIDDVTEARQAETRLKEQNLRLSALSAELAESKKNLKVKLERIENLNSNLEQMAFFDRLTGLPNRLRFTAVLTAQIEEARRKGERVALAILDVDNLKTLNDSLPRSRRRRSCPDGARLKAYECDTILASRFGGDEFLIIFREFEHEAEMLHVINAIREDLEKNYSWEDAPLHSSVSTGAAIFPDDADTLENLLKYADIAMTDAKRRGKNTLSLFHSVMQENLMNRLKMESRMTDTLEKGLFQVYFQPQVDSITGDLKGFEALVRWFDTELGYISPDRFIPLAEESKIIIALGDWILDTVCRILASWRSELGFTGTVSVNISPVQLKCRDFTEKLKRTLDKYGIDPEAIEIEITEGILIDNFDQVIEILNVIKKMGMRISLDDFGTGYSSLSYLQFIPLDTLKIDKSFIANITRDGRIEYEITNAIVTLVNKLGLNTIAEGVETKEQMDVIRAISAVPFVFIRASQPGDRVRGSSAQAATQVLPDSPIAQKISSGRYRRQESHRCHFTQVSSSKISTTASGGIQAVQRYQHPFFVPITDPVPIDVFLAPADGKNIDGDAPAMLAPARAVADFAPVVAFYAGNLGKKTRNLRV